jgi:hypothetical protein
MKSDERAPEKLEISVLFFRSGAALRSETLSPRGEQGKFAAPLRAGGVVPSWNGGEIFVYKSVQQGFLGKKEKNI